MHGTTVKKKKIFFFQKKEHLWYRKQVPHFQLTTSDTYPTIYIAHKSKATVDLTSTLSHPQNLLLDIQVCWVVTLFQQANCYRRFGRTIQFPNVGIHLESARNTPGDLNLLQHPCEDLKCSKLFLVFLLESCISKQVYIDYANHKL
jgi:hypothetical protein